MLDKSTPVSEIEDNAEAARADLAQALDLLRDRLTPAHMLAAIGQGARNAARPLFEPVLEQAKSSRGIIVLGVSAAALLFGLGRASAKKGEAAPQARAPDPADVAVAEAGPPPKPAKAPRAHAASGGGLVKTIIVSAAALAAGSALAKQVPLTEQEKRFAASTGRDVKDWARQIAQHHSGEMLNAAVNAFGVARGLGSLLALLALAGSHSNRASQPPDRPQD